MSICFQFYIVCVTQFGSVLMKNVISNKMGNMSFTVEPVVIDPIIHKYTIPRHYKYTIPRHYKCHHNLRRIAQPKSRKNRRRS